MIEPRVVLIVIIRLSFRGEKIVGRAWKIGQWNFSKQRYSRVIERQADRVVRKGRAAGRVHDGNGKFTRPLRGGGDAEKLRHGIPYSLPIVVQEEKCLVLCDRAAQCRAELALPEGRRLVRWSKKVPRVEYIVPEKFVDASVEAVRSG